MKFRVAAALLLLVILVAPVRAQDDTPAKPCSTPEHRQFDFWIGSWDVHTADGTLAGTNSINQTLGTCVLEEHWNGVRGLEGKSYNIYSAADGKWHQTWVDTQGRRLQLAGGFKDGKMIMSGETLTPNGPVLDKITWEALEDGRVRQHWQRSSDFGETWNDLFVGLYSRQKK